MSVYSYGVFARQARGEPSYALPVHPSQTVLDRVLAPQWDEHPGETGMILLQDNLDAFVMRAVTAREAGRSLDLQYYIWHDDLTGQLLDMELLRAADRGVRVRLLLDDMTAHDRSSTMSILDTHPNIEIRIFNPTRARDTGLKRGIEMLLRAFSINRRMHNKAWIADGRVAIVGGRNIGDEYFDAASNMNFFDVDLIISGPAVAETSAIFDSYWNSPAVIPLSALVSVETHELDALRKKIADNADKLFAQPYLQQLRNAPGVKDLFNGQRPVHWTSEIHVYADPAEKAFGQGQDQWLIHRLNAQWQQATHSFTVISPYFVPRNSGMALFRSMRERGIAIEILTNSLAATDVFLVHGGYAPYRQPLLEMGAQLYELKPTAPQDHSLLGSSGASLHTKAFLIDGQTAFIGSLNFDPRSVIWNTEMGIILREPTIAAELMDEFKRRTSSRYSYKLILEHSQLRWLDTADGDKPVVWKHDPQTRWWQRTVASIVRWLPIESQL